MTREIIPFPFSPRGELGFPIVEHGKKIGWVSEDSLGSWRTFIPVEVDGKIVGGGGNGFYCSKEAAIQEVRVVVAKRDAKRF